MCASDPSWFARIAACISAVHAITAFAVIAATCTLEAVQIFLLAGADASSELPTAASALHFWGVQCVGMGRNALKRSAPGRKKTSTKDLTSFKELSVNLQRSAYESWVSMNCHHPQIHSTNAWLVVILLLVKPIL